MSPHAAARIKTLLKRASPGFLLEWHRRRHRARLRAENLSRSVQEVFTRIYERNEWGGRAGDFCSGTGSVDALAEDYGRVVREFIQTQGARSVLDLGCGDFSVGRRLQLPGVRYLGVDVVEALVERNQRQFGAEMTSFQCLDIIADPLPGADVCLIRQVLQHLSNAQIAAILEKVRAYRWVIITEHYPAPDVTLRPNVDKPHGGDVRIFDDSAVVLDQPPFNRTDLRLLHEIPVADPLKRPGETLRSFLLTHPSDA